MTNAAVLSDVVATPGRRGGAWHFVRRNPTLAGGILILVVFAGLALAAPLIAGDPIAMKPADRLMAPSHGHWFCTDHLGRDVWARSVYGARISLIVGLAVAAISVGIGLGIGLLAGFVTTVETVVMRLMD